VGVGVTPELDGVATFGAGLGAGNLTPFFHTIFLPNLMQVYLYPAAIAVLPTLVHARPDFTAALEGMRLREIKSTIAKTVAKRAFIVKA